MYCGGGITPRGIRTWTGIGASTGLGVAMIAGVGVAVAGAGFGVCPSAEQMSTNVMIKNCVIMLSDNLNKRIQIPPIRWFGRALRGVARTETKIRANSGILSYQRQARGKNKIATARASGHVLIHSSIC